MYYLILYLLVFSNFSYLMKYENQTGSKLMRFICVCTPLFYLFIYICALFLLEIMN